MGIRIAVEGRGFYKKSQAFDANASFDCASNEKSSMLRSGCFRAQSKWIMELPKYDADYLESKTLGA